MVRRVLFALCVVLAAVLVGVGVFLIWVPAGFIVSGVLLAGTGWFLLAGDDAAPAVPLSAVAPVDDVPAVPVIVRRVGE